MTIKELLNKGNIMLKVKQIENSKLKARLLLAHILKMTRQELIVYDNKEVEKQKEQEYFKNIEKLIKGIPLQHITKKQEFMKLDFIVNENVLIPRPDTEILVEEVIKIANKIKMPKILDLCTGSGAIAISLAKYIKEATIYASDISKKALEVAKENAKQNDIDNIKFIESDLFENINETKFDIIVSNPPYIKTEIINNLDEEVKKEPIIALDGGKDGLSFYKKIIPKAKEYLRMNGYLCFEIGYDQKIDVIELIENEKIYNNTYGKKDLYNNDRIIVTRKEKVF